MAVLTYVPFSQTVASSHREAPLISTDPLADNTDVYAFKSPTDAEKIILIANYIPFEDPNGGPNWYTFGQNIRYEIHVKNNANTPGDDITYRFMFKTTNEDPTTFFNIRLGKQNQKSTYTCERSIDGGRTFQMIVSNGKVPPPNIGPRSIENATVGLGAASYNALATQAIMTASTGERVFCGPVDDPFFVDLGGAFDVGGFRKPGRDAVAKYNCHTIAIEVPVATLQKDRKTVAMAANILDPDFVVGVWASSSRQRITTLYDGGDVGADGNWVQVSRLGMPLTNEAVIPIGMKDRWNSVTPYNNNDLQFAQYFTNPELALYMDDSKFGGAVPGLAALRIQANSLGAFDFRNGKPGLFSLKGTSALTGTALDDAVFGTILLPNNASPRAVDLLPIFYTGVPNLRPYQLATGKAGGSPLAAGKPFIHNFLPTLGDMLRLNMAVPATPRNSPDFNSLGLVYAAVLGLTDSRFNANANLQSIPNMDGFPNGRRLEDDVTTIELQAVSGVVLAAIGLWYDDFTPGQSPVTPKLGSVLGFNAGVTKNDTTMKAAFPFVQDPWRGFLGNQYVGPNSFVPAPSQPLAATVVAYNCATGEITFGRTGGDPNRAVEYRAVGVVNGGYGTSTNRMVEAGVRADPNTRNITIMVRYVGEPMSEASTTFDFRARCAGRIANEGAESLSMRVMGNPVTSDEVMVEVRGASGEQLRLQVVSSRGQVMSQQTIGTSGAVEYRTMRIGSQTGIYLLQAVTPTSSQTIRVLRQ